MFREMRRGGQMLPEEENERILREGSHGVLAVGGDGGYPYAVPLSFFYDGRAIYFHCAKQGHKLDAIRRDERVSFCVVDKDDVVQEKYTTLYRSVIAFGRARVVEDPGEKRAAVTSLAEKYSPDHRDGIAAAVDSEWNALNIVRIDIEHVTGKEARELAAGRPAGGQGRKKEE